MFLKIYKPRKFLPDKLLCTGTIVEGEYGECQYTLQYEQGGRAETFNVGRCVTLKNPQVLTRIKRAVFSQFHVDHCRIVIDSG